MAEFAPEVSTASIAIVKDAEPVPTTNTLEPVLNPAPPANTRIWLINPENTSETNAVASLEASPPETITVSPTL